VAAPPKTSPAAATDPVAWKELKDLESLEYAMPKNVLPRDDEKVEAAPTPQPAPAPAPSPAPAPKTSGASEWGDLMESLKKDLGQ
jgi:hypothetical protein